MKGVINNFMRWEDHECNGGDDEPFDRLHSVSRNTFLGEGSTGEYTSPVRKVYVEPSEATCIQDVLYNVPPGA